MDEPCATDAAAHVRATKPEALAGMISRFPDAPELTLIRFLLARQCKLDKAAAMYAAHVAWRAETLPIPDSPEIRTSLASRKYYILDSPDSDGHPVVFVNLLRFKLAKYNV